MYKKFTLIEVIIAIVVIGILTSIVVANILNLKKDAIYSSINQNISILQNSVDEYYIKEEKYPIETERDLSLENPQLINIDYLKEKGLLKNNLVEGKIPQTYYWLDVFGKVWGSTENEPLTINQLNQSENDKRLEVLIGNKIQKYNIYETFGYSVSYNSKYSTLEASQELINKSYKLIEEVNVNPGKEKYVDFYYPNKKATYLISTIDEYGLESAPMGKYSKNNHFETLKGDGVYYFEIENEKEMYWLNFIVEEEKPGNSTIDYEFRVKDKDGNWLEWSNDFYLLENSKAIEIKVSMKSDLEGNKPTLYDLRVVFKYLDDLEDPPVLLVNPKDADLEGVCPERTIESTIGTYVNSSVKGPQKIVNSFKSKELDSLSELTPPSLVLYAKYKLISTEYYYHDGESYKELTDLDFILNDDCMLVVYNVYLYESILKEPVERICGNGGSYSNYNSNPSRYVYHLGLTNNEFIKSFNVKIDKSDWIVKKIYVEYSYNQEDYVVAKSITEIPDNSCVNIVYELIKVIGYGPIKPEPPIVEFCKGDNCQPVQCKEDCISAREECNGDNCEEDNTSWCSLNPNNPACQDFIKCMPGYEECIPPVCTTDCSVGPPSIPEINDPEWTTVDIVRFFAHGKTGQVTYWYAFEETDSLTKNDISKDLENSRIVYKFAAGSGSSWGNVYDEFKPINSTSILAVAYIQVRTKELENIPPEKYQEVEKVKFFSTEGILELNSVQPTLAIVAEKDNNLGREQYSNASNLKWSINAADPKNRKIINYEWDFIGKSETQPTPFNNYEVGEYVIKARVENSIHIWSEWTTFRLKVYEEKPKAVISFKTSDNLSFISEKNKVVWNFGSSVDGDGDKIVRAEWSESKKATYDIGKHTVSLKVQDEEGYWSDLTEISFEVFPNGDRIYRIEAEDRSKLVYHESSEIINGENLSNKKGLHLRGIYSNNNASLILEFEGTGVDIAFISSNGGSIKLDGEFLTRVTYNEPTIHSIRNLPDEKHTLVLESHDLVLSHKIDYIDVYSKKDNMSILSKQQQVLDKNENVIKAGNDMSLNVGQKIKTTVLFDKDGDLKFEIISPDNKVVKNESRKIKGGSYGLNAFIWDGISDSGQKQKTGVYTLKFTMKGIYGQVVVDTLTINLNSEVPVYRIEAEDKIKASWHDYSRVLFSDKYSNGAGLYLRGQYDNNNAYYTLKFKGTGIDIQFIESKNSNISLNGTFIEKVSFNEPTIYSLRDLENKEHTLVLATMDSLNSHKIDYIDIYNSNDEISVLSSKQEVVDSTGRVITDGNVVVINTKQAVKNTFDFDKDGSLEVQILNSSGKVIKNHKRTIKGGTYGLNDFTWDGKSNEGVSQKTGEYKLKLIMTGIYGTKSIKEFTILLENEQPVYRVEAEDDKKLTYHTSSQILSNASYSNGKALYLKGMYSNNNAALTLKFKGTGLDISLLSSKNAEIILDGKILEKVTYAESTIYSIRNLENIEHTLTLKSLDSVNAHYIDYIDVYNSDDKPSIIYSKQEILETNNSLIRLGNILNVVNSQKVRTTFDIDKDSDLTINVLNPKKEVVFSKNYTIKGGSYGLNSFTWDGYSSKGIKQLEGIYELEFLLTGINGSKNTIKMDIDLKSTEKKERIEAEDKNKANYHNSSVILLAEEYSDGKGLYLRGIYSNNNAHYVLEFEGTGVDIAFIESNFGDIFLNGVLIEKVKFENKTIYPIRNLENKKHTLTLRSNDATLSHKIDFIDIYN